MISLKNGGKAILIVEDDSAIQSTLQQIFEAFGYPHCAVNNGQQALDLLKCNPNGICLILLDLFMPVMDGWQFLEHLQSQEITSAGTIPPVVIMSAAGGIAKETAEKYQGYLKKPIELDQLLSLVEKLCASGHPVLTT